MTQDDDLNNAIAQASARVEAIKAKKQPFSLTQLEETKSYLDAGLPADMAEWSDDDWDRADAALEAAKNTKIERLTLHKRGTD